MRSRALRRGQRHTQESLGSWGYTSNKCKWKTLFAKRRKLDYKTENTPYLQWWAEIREDNEDPEAVERHPGDEHDESFVRVFMSPLDESNVNEPQADKIEEFCAGATLEQLYAEDGEGGAKQAPVAWLDERGMKGDILCSRPYRSHLTARDLYHELKKPVNAFTFQRGRNRLLLTLRPSAIQVVNRAIAVAQRMARTKRRVGAQPHLVTNKVVKLTSTLKDV